MTRAANSGFAALAALLVLSSAGGCARAKPRATPPVVEAPTPPEPPAPAERPTPPPLPPVVEAPAAPPSIGPRPETAPEPPAVTERPAPPQPAPPAPSVPPAPPVPPAQKGRYVVLNFDSADIETVVHAASEIVGFNYVIAPDVRGKVTVQTSGRIPQEDVFGVLLAILEVHGFTAVKSGNLYKIIRIEGARERAVPTIIGAEADLSRTTDEIVTQIVPVRYSSVTDLGTLLRPLISSRGTLVAHRETNILIITDAASNMRRLLDIVRLVDIEVALDELQIIPIKHADAGDLAAVLTQLFTSGRLRRAAAPGGPAAPPAAPGAARPPATPASVADAAGPERAPLIIAERRSNSLIIYSRRVDLETIRRLIGQLDVNIYGGRRVFIYYAESAKSKDLAATLNGIYGGRDATPTTPTSSTAPRRPGEPPPPPPPPPAAPGPPVGGGAPIGELGIIEGQVRFIADETTNSVIVTTFPRNWEEIEATIKQLDRQPRQVLIEVLVAEITLTDDLRLGIDWAIKIGSLRVAQSTISPATITAPSRELPIPGLPLALPGGGLTAFALDSDKFFAMLNTLASENKVNVLSSPHVMTSENKKAVINVSDSIPIITSQQVPIGAGAVSGVAAGQTTAVVGTQTVEYRDAGVILTVTPRIGERGTVALEVKQEVNDIGAAEPPTGSRRIIKREAETAVVLMNNMTLVLGGLIRDRLAWEDRGVPFFKDIPLLGYLFGAKVRTTTKTELIILITPRVVGTALDAARITDEMKRVTPDLEEAVRRAPRPPSSTPLPRTPAPMPPPTPSPAEPGRSSP